MSDAERTRRVAVASSDGRLIDRHLGQSDVFRIYEIDAGGAHRFLEERRAPARLDRHSVDGLPGLLGDVDVVLACRAGPGAIRALGTAGVQVFALEGPVAAALAAIARRGFVLDAPPDRRAATPGDAPGPVAPGDGAAACGSCDCAGGCSPGASSGPAGGCEGCR